MSQKISRAVKGRIREMIALELRGRIADSPPDGEPIEVLEAWALYVREIADQITPRR